MSKMKDETGNRYGRLTVLERASNANNGQAQWLCKCDCGNECVVTGSNLRRGRQVSCGCYFVDMVSKNDVPSEYKATRLYTIWQRMLYRCTNKNSNRYYRYGGRGIKVCSEWSEDFMSFYQWAMSHGYKDSLTLDRIDFNGDYTPSNCRWATAKEQMRNREDNHLITYNGETKCVTEWSEQYGLNAQTIFTRIYMGWTNSKEILFGRKRGIVNG